MVQAGIRPVIAVEFDPSKPELSRAFVLDVAVGEASRREGIAFNHHHNFHEYGCKVIQQTVQEVAQSEFAGFPRRPDYLHDYQTMTTKTPKPPIYF
jgi:DNA (cytosine-5)-methyltransferase 1